MRGQVQTRGRGSGWFALAGGLVVALALCAPAADADLVGYWDFDEGAGLTAVDSSAYGNNGTLKNMSGTEWEAGHSGAASDFALHLDGANDFVQVPDSPSVSVTGDLSLSAWIKGDSDGLGNWVKTNANVILAKDANNAYRLRVDSTSWWLLLNDGSGSPSYQILHAGQPIPAGSWQHVAVTADFTDNKARFYLNGGLVTEKTITETSIKDTAGRLTIGSYSTSGAESFGGVLDDVAIWDEALGAKTVNALAKGWVAPNDRYAQAVLNDSPVAYWRLDDAPGSTVARDLTGVHDGAYSGSLALGAPSALIGDPTNPSADFSGGTMIASSLTGLQEQFSVEFWMNPRTHVNYNQMISAGVSGWGQFLFHTTNDGNIAVGQNWTGGNAWTVGAGSLELDEWQHFVYTLAPIVGDPTHGLASFYKDGVLVSSRVLGLGDPWTSFRINANVNGLVDEVAVYDYPLTAADVFDHYQASLPEPTALALLGGGLLVLWRRRRKA